MYFHNYDLQKTWKDNCLKSPILDNHSKSKIVNEPNHCCNLSSITVAIFIDHCEYN